MLGLALLPHQYVVLSEGRKEGGREKTKLYIGNTRCLLSFYYKVNAAIALLLAAVAEPKEAAMFAWKLQFIPYLHTNTQVALSISQLLTKHPWYFALFLHFYSYTSHSINARIHVSLCVLFTSLCLTSDGLFNLQYVWFIYRRRFALRKKKNQSLATALYETQVGRIRLQANGY